MTEQWSFGIGAPVETSRAAHRLRQPMHASEIIGTRIAGIFALLRENSTTLTMV